MKKSLIQIILLIILSTISIHAQTTKIKLGEKSVTVKGKIFNDIIYNFSYGKNKSVAYQFLDKGKMALIITEITYEFEGEKSIATVIQT